MKVLDDGHIYELENVDGSINGGPTQQLHFVRRRDWRGELLPESVRQPGILTQELLRVAIDRTLYLHAEAPCDEDTRIVEHLRAAFSLFESRASRRAIEKLSKPELATACTTCGHIACMGHDLR